MSRIRSWIGSDRIRRTILEVDPWVHQVLVARHDGDRIDYHLPRGWRTNTEFPTVREALGLVDYIPNGHQREVMLYRRVDVHSSVRRVPVANTDSEADPSNRSTTASAVAGSSHRVRTTFEPRLDRRNTYHSGRRWPTPHPSRSAVTLADTTLILYL